ncbi:MAG: S41 family peptidase [Bacillota bacterium]
MRAHVRCLALNPRRSAIALCALAACLCVALTGCSSAKLADLPLTTEQKIEDFRYMAEVFLESNPYLWVSERKTGYDWQAHLDEFEAEIAATKDDAEFAQAMARILRRLNNGHTSLTNPGTASLYGGFLSGLYMGRWKAEVNKTTQNRIQYWWDLANPNPQPAGSQPAGSSGAAFGAAYSAGRYYVVSVSSEAEEGGLDIRPGWEIAKVDGVPVNEYVSRLMGEQTLWYDPVRDCLYLRWLQIPLAPGQSGSEAAPSESGVAPSESGTASTEGGSLSVVFRTGDGEEVSLDIPSGWSLNVPRSYWPPRYKDAAGVASRGNMYTAILEGGIMYVQIRSMMRDPDSDLSRLRRLIEKEQPEALIIDIRGNGGGSDNYWQSLVAMLAEESVSSTFGLAWRKSEYCESFVEQKGAHKKPTMPRSDLEAMAAAGSVPPELLTGAFEDVRVWERTVNPSKESLRYKGRIALLVDDYVFSSAESFAAFCKGSGWATLIGSFTGGDGIGFDPGLVTLPNSGMLVRFPLDMGLNPDMSANEEVHTLPDVLAEWGPEDILRYASTWGTPDGPDPAWDPQLRACLKWLAGE